MQKKPTLAVLAAAALLSAWTLVPSASALRAQTHHHHESDGRKIVFPNIPGFQTLKSDFHIHTVFSDGNVWPNIRVQEALRDGLDVISLTEHLEYQPHKDDIPHPDRNRSYEIALAEAEGSDLMIVHGSEVTRSMPPGHSNAIFIQDANKLMLEDPIEVFREAKRQGAFVFWNHPGWVGQRADGVAALEPMHRQLLEEGLLQGIEVVNDLTFSDEALQIAIDEGLTIMGTSDVHGLIDWRYRVPEGGHRPLALVFAKERSEESLKEALFAGRAVAWLNQLLVGKEELIVPLVEESLVARSVSYIERGDDSTTVLQVEIENTSSASYLLRNLSDYSMQSSADVVTLEGRSTTTLEIRTLVPKTSVEMEFEVLNAVTAPRTHPTVTLGWDVE